MTTPTATRSRELLDEIDQAIMKLRARRRRVIDWMAEAGILLPCDVCGKLAARPIRGTNRTRSLGKLCCTDCGAKINR